MNSEQLLSLTEQHYSQANFLETIRVAEEVISTAEQEQKPLLKLRALILLGNATSFMADYVTAIECFQRASDFAHTLNNHIGISGVLNAIGYMYLSIGEFEKAKKNLLEANSGLDDNSELRGIILLNLSIVELHDNNFEKALSFCNTAIEILTANNVERSLGYALINHCTINLKLQDYTSALASITKAESIFTSIKDKLGLGQVFVLFGDMYCTEMWQHYNYVNSEKYLIKAIESLTEVGARKHLYEAHRILAKLYQMQNMWEKSCYHLKQEYVIESEVHTSEVQKKTALLEAELSMAVVKKEAEINYLRNVELLEVNQKLEKAMKELKEGEQQLIHSEKMASLGQLTAGIAHELNNPISFINSSISPLKRDLEFLLSKYVVDNENEELNEVKLEVESLLRAIEDGAKRTSDIVIGLRTFVRLDEGAAKSVNIHEGIDATLILLRSQLRDSIIIEKKYGDIPLIKCSPGPVNQVFMNILVNAIQATPDKGTITITTTQEYPNIKVSIRDTGTGMKNEVISRIFEPFYTTKSVGEGTGLGLSVSYGIIKKHNGTITVHSEIGVGTEFIITLPID